MQVESDRKDADCASTALPLNYDDLTDQQIYRLAGRAFDRLHEHATPPDPQSYAVWFSYVAGSNERIVKAINGMLHTGRAIDRLAMTRLHEAFIANGFVDDAQRNIGLELECSIAAMDELVEDSVHHNKVFQETLDRTHKELSSTSTPEDLGTLVTQLRAQNEVMLRSNNALGEGLQRSRYQIVTLNRRLEELESISLKDPLTGIFNRRAFDARLKQEIEAVSAEKSLCLAMVDIDHFKRINDLLGHQSGDEVLISIAKLLSLFAEDDAIVARYGGEEFVILMPDLDVIAAHNKLVKLKWQIGQMKCLSAEDHSKIGCISASFGLGAFKPGRTAATLIEAADQKLYEAKQSGRNAVRSEAIGR